MDVGELFYPRATGITSQSLRNRTAQACNVVCQRLMATDLAAIGVSAYNQRYVGDKMRRRIAECSLLVYAMQLIAGELGDDVSQFSFVDFGAGFGFNSLVARHLGFRKIFYCDIYDVSADDARRIGEALALPADAYIVGNLPDLTDAVSRHGETCDALLSTDTIEHVYDTDQFFRHLSALPAKRLAICLTSHANQRQPRTRRILSTQAREAELQDRETVWGHKARDAVRSYLSIRREIIRHAAPSLPDHEIEALAIRTRGRRQDDILNAVTAYLERGERPAAPDHPTNTCDPYTGNWAERLMDPVELAAKMRDYGMSMRAIPGYWPNDPGHPAKHAVKTLINAAIAASGTFGLRMSPNYILIGSHEPTPATA